MGTNTEREPQGGGPRDNGKENGDYYSILGLYRDNGKENGNYYLSLGLWVEDPRV